MIRKNKETPLLLDWFFWRKLYRALIAKVRIFRMKRAIKDMGKVSKTRSEEKVKLLMENTNDVFVHALVETFSDQPIDNERITAIAASMARKKFSSTVGHRDASLKNTQLFLVKFAYDYGKEYDKIKSTLCPNSDRGAGVASVHNSGDSQDGQ
jgi:hypothetical protein